jgi:hypothetical protein
MGWIELNIVQPIVPPAVITLALLHMSFFRRGLQKDERKKLAS